MNFRNVLTLTCIGVTTLAFAGCNSNKSSVLFVQSTEAGSLTPVEGKKGTFTLELSKPNPHVTFFTDRPERHAGTMSISQFLGIWNQGKDSFETDPPNAALAVASEPLKTMVFELADPVAGKDDKSVQYTATLVSDPYMMTQSINKSHEFGFASLFIDDYSPYNYGDYYGAPALGGIGQSPGSSLGGGGYGGYGGGYGWGGERGYWPGGWHYNTITDPGVSSQEGKTDKGVNDWIDARTQKARELKKQGEIPPWVPETQGQ
ncbi:MAG: hypothetical protein P8J86_00280 [Phycisphaerales bacterium]|jgi:hypothetical protein|nr:hypothetical protein [Phycisphaerales bacterium]